MQLIPSREKHPRLWAILIWCAVTAIPIFAGGFVGALGAPKFVYWGLLVLWLPIWVIVCAGLFMVFTPKR